MYNNVSPLRYPGGKNITYPYVRKIVAENNCSTYVEPYCGGAAVAMKLLMNNDVDRIMINDIDTGIYSFWYAILNETDRFLSEIENVNISIEEWRKQKEIFNLPTSSIFEKGFATFFLNRTNRSGIISGGPIGGYEQQSKYKLDCRFNKNILIDKIEKIAAKKSKIHLYNEDAVKFISKNVSRTKNSFTFFDPPYFVKGPQLYRNFYSMVDHEELAKTIFKYMKNKKWILTYDVSPFIEELYSEFEHFTYSLRYSAGHEVRGLEYIFYSKLVSSNNVDNFLKIKSDV